MATDLNDKYDPQERWKAVVDHSRGTLVINAGPGTGKTFSLLRKAEQLLGSNVPPSHIYYLTFTNSIVNAFADDVAKPKDKGGLGDTVEHLGFKVSTLHSLAFKIIRTHQERLGIPRHVELFDADSSSPSLLAQIASSDLYVVAKLRDPSLGKRDFNSGLDRLRGLWQTEANIPHELQALETAVELQRKSFETLPWDRLVPIANEAILKHGLPSWLQEATHFMVDEFQDFNPSEQRHIQLITQPSDSVVIVGDTDQSIYSGRSASPQGLEALLDRSDTSTVNFVYCRRCPRTVIDGANKVLKYMDPEGADDKLLQPHKPDQGHLEFREQKSFKAEVEFLAAAIGKWIAESVPCVLLLFPSRKALTHYKEALAKHGITGDTSTGDSSELPRALLRLVVLRDHPFLVRVLVRTHPDLERRFGPDILPMIMDKGLSVREALSAASESSGWRKPVQADYESFTRELEALSSGDPELVAEALRAHKLDVTADQVQDLLSADPDTEMPGRIDALLSSKETQGENAATRVRFVTYHSSKGLSEPNVVLPAMEDKLIPGTAAGVKLEEKHRLFYVALTRAESGVLMTFPKMRARRDPLNYSPDGAADGPSRYVTLLKT